LAGSFSAKNLTGQAGFKVQLDLIEKKGGVWRIVDPIFGVWLAG